MAIVAPRSAMPRDRDDTVETVLAAETRVGDFRIRELLGEGAMGHVYLAQDMTLGRRVALKIIKREVVRAHGLERFLAEARATAAFNHPNIVTLHAVGQFDGRPFLALEYVDGESLRSRTASGRMAPRVALRVIKSIADAIAEAHRRGVVHADLKPENVVIPPDGRLRVVDFGLARFAGTGGGTASGTPAYMAPERWTGAAPTEAIDVWALGVMLFELMTGSRPIPDHGLASFAFSATEVVLPADCLETSWRPLVAECLSRSPDARPAASQVARRVEAMLDPRVARSDDARSPFPGMVAFDRADAVHYHGRQAELDAVIERLRTRPLIPIVGPSGIGKSSFVMAGLLPRLDELESWTTLHFRPGSSPFDNLATALQSEAPGGLAVALRDHPARLSLELSALANRRKTRILLFIDQFEEAFTLASHEAAAFSVCLALAALAEEPWRIVITVRDDFVGRLAEAAPMRPHLGSVAALQPLSPSDLRAAITEPLAAVGYATDSHELEDRIVAEVAGQPACLPLLQFVCRALWERRDAARRLLVTREYEAMGGASGALATIAQQCLVQLSSAETRLLRSIMLELVHTDGTRRPRLRSELIADLGPVTDKLLDRLLEGRLLIASREAENADASIELAHESLVTAWPQLAHWLDETHEERLLVHEIEQASVLWSRRGRRDEETWVGAALEETARKVRDWNVALSARSREFLDAGSSRADRTRRRRRRTISLTVGGLGAVALAAVIAAIVAIRQQAQIRLAAADMGTFELILEPYDWDAKGQRARPPSSVPDLEWRLRAVSPDDPRRPGRIYAQGEAGDLRRGHPRWSGNVLSETVEARSGPAFLEVTRRGGTCGVSRIYLQHLPGYTERVAPAKQIRVRVPTCQASTAGMVAIEPGEFWRNVNREDGTPVRDEPQVMPGYSMDRTEVSRGAFDVYEGLSRLTGDVSAPGDYLKLDPTARESLPVVGVTFYTARAYCEYLGKRLPTIDEWQKAFRGGVSIRGAANPLPRRTVPWLTATSGRPANMKPDDGRGAPAPVGTYPDDESPYGVVDLAGNVAEWSTSPANERGLRAVLGGTWATAVSDHSEEITWRNARADMAISFEIGFRCVADYPGR